MKGYECKKCGMELQYEQLPGGIRVKREKDGKLYYSVYCPKCKEYFESEI